jgi:hypothetical protein
MRLLLFARWLPAVNLRTGDAFSGFAIATVDSAKLVVDYYSVDVRAISMPSSAVLSVYTMLPPLVGLMLQVHQACLASACFSLQFVLDCFAGCSTATAWRSG